MTSPRIAVVLGAAVWADGPSPTLRRRTAAAIGLWQAGTVTHILGTGGLGDHPPSEGAAIAALAREAGVPEEALLTEEHSRNTAENLRFARPLLEGATVTLVSDWYHLPRARLLARREGLGRVQTASAGLRGARPWPQIKAALRELPALALTLLGLHPKGRPQP